MSIKKYGRAILLNDHITCDGYSPKHPIRVQTHFHLDHMNKFARSTSKQKIICTKATLDLIVKIKRLESLLYRDNVIPLNYGEEYEVDDHKITLYDSGHMLGAAQVLIEDNQGKRIGYSGDFNMPLDHIMKCDELFIDGTYGDQNAVRIMTQEQVEHELIELIQDNIHSRSIRIHAKTGIVMRGLKLISRELKNIPIIVSPKLERQIMVYKNYGIDIGKYYTPAHEDFPKIYDEDRYIRVDSSGDRPHSGLTNNQIGIELHAFYGRRKGIQPIGDNSYVAALSDHADFKGTMDYIKETGAKKIYTDPWPDHKKASQFSITIETDLGLKSRPAEELELEE